MKVSLKGFALLITIALSLPQWSSPATICIDLNGVLLKNDRMKSGSAIGMNHCIGYMMYRSTSMSPEGFLYHILRQIRPGEHNKTGVFSGKLEIPTITCEWLKGTRPNCEILEEIQNGINDNPHLFANKSERNIISNISRYMMTADTFASTVSIIPNGQKLLKACYKEKDKNGERKHKLYVVSNWDSESLKKLYKRKDLQQFWSMFDGIYASGELNKLKPENGFYQELKKTMSPEEELCIFIDDQPENLVTARKHGFYTINGKRPQRAKMRLKKLGIIT